MAMARSTTVQRLVCSVRVGWKVEVELPGAQVALVRLGRCWMARAAEPGRSSSGAEPRLQGLDNLPGDALLNLEDLGDGAGEPLGPELGVGARSRPGAR